MNLNYYYSLTMSFKGRRPKAKTIAFGGVDTGRTYAYDAHNVTGIIVYKGLISNLSACVE